MVIVGTCEGITDPSPEDCEKIRQEMMSWSPTKRVIWCVFCGLFMGMALTDKIILTTPLTAGVVILAFAAVAGGISVIQCRSAVRKF